MRHLKKRLLPLGILLLAILWLCDKTLLGLFILLAVGIFIWVPRWLAAGWVSDCAKMQRLSKKENREAVSDEEIITVFDESLSDYPHLSFDTDPSTGEFCMKVKYPSGTMYF